MTEPADGELERMLAELRVAIERAVINDSNSVIIAPRDNAERLFAAVRARLKEDEWQDISTAPKDGTTVLGARGTHVDLTRWSPRFADVYGDTSAGWYSESLDRRWEPTHWRPLPKPPALHPKDRGG